MAQDEGFVKVSPEEVIADKEEGLTSGTAGVEKVEERTPTSGASTTNVEEAPGEEVTPEAADEEGGKASVKDKIKGKLIQVGDKLRPKSETEAKQADPNPGLA